MQSEWYSSKKSIDNGFEKEATELCTVCGFFRFEFEFQGKG